MFCGCKGGEAELCCARKPGRVVCSWWQILQLSTFPGLSSHKLPKKKRPARVCLVSLVPPLPPCLEPFSPLRNLNGDLEIAGDLYLDTVIHANVAEVLQALTALATCSVDLTSLSVEGKDSPCVW